MKPKIILKFLTYALVIAGLYGCPPLHCDEQLTVYSDIPDSILQKVPYKNDTVYQFKHSKGTIIDFLSSSQIIDQQPCYRCDCYEYQELEIILQTEYPISDIEIYLRPISDSIYDLNIQFGFSSFQLFNITGNKVPTDKIDINGHEEDVLVLTDNWDDQFNLYADTLFYSFRKGIVKISMSNNENYTLYEE